MNQLSIVANATKLHTVLFPGVETPGYIQPTLRVESCRTGFLCKAAWESICWLATQTNSLRYDSALGSNTRALMMKTRTNSLRYKDAPGSNT